jgi:hypothetical protein
MKDKRKRENLHVKLAISLVNALLNPVIGLSFGAPIIAIRVPVAQIKESTMKVRTLGNINTETNI